MNQKLIKALKIAIKVLEGDKSFKIMEMYDAKIELMALLVRESNR